MHPIWRVVGISFVFGLISVAWLVFGAVMVERTHQQSNKLHGRVADLWGSSHAQEAPELTFEWEVERDEVTTEQVDGVERVVHKRVKVRQSTPMRPQSTHIHADFELDQRLKGLMWYALYNVTFKGQWSYVH
ncbi:MAG: inner membrane CreD family protein, partial [Myxococcota bacterium]